MTSGDMKQWRQFSAQGWGFHSRIPRTVNENRVAESCHICWELSPKCSRYANLGSLQTVGRAGVIFSRCPMLVRFLFLPCIAARAFPSILLCFPQGISGTQWEGQRAEEENELSPIRSTPPVWCCLLQEDPFALGFMWYPGIHLLSFSVSELDLSWEHSPRPRVRCKEVLGGAQGRGSALPVHLPGAFLCSLGTVWGVALLCQGPGRAIGWCLWNGSYRYHVLWKQRALFSSFSFPWSLYLSSFRCLTLHFSRGRAPASNNGTCLAQ